MEEYSRRLVPLGCSIFAFLATVPALAADVVMGANLVNEPYKQSISEQENTFRVLQAVGVHVIRADIPGNDQGIDFAQRADAHGIKVVWLMGIYPDSGTQWPREPDTYKGKSFGRWRE